MMKQMGLERDSFHRMNQGPTGQVNGDQATELEMG